MVGETAGRFFLSLVTGRIHGGARRQRLCSIVQAYVLATKNIRAPIHEPQRKVFLDDKTPRFRFSVDIWRNIPPGRAVPIQ